MASLLQVFLSSPAVLFSNMLLRSQMHQMCITSSAINDSVIPCIPKYLVFASSFLPWLSGCKKIYICTHKSIIGRISSTIGTSMMIDFSPYLPYTFQRGDIRNKMLYILISSLDKKLKWQCKHFPSLFHS